VTIDAGELPHEQVVLGHGLIAGAQKTGYDDSERFVEMALQVADMAAERLLQQSACADDACLRTWAGGFLPRAFRGPQPPAVIGRYAAILAAPEAGSTPAERMTTFLGAVLSSPHFTYRKEIGTVPAGGNPRFRRLDAHEIATRLSYLVWQSMPDPELMTAAGQGALLAPASRLVQLDRMLKDARTRRGLRGFVSDWLALFENHLAKKAPDLLKDAGADFPAVAQRGFDLLVDDVLGAIDRARFTDLLVAEHAFANAALARVMGVTGPATATDFQRVALRAGERRGVLTHPLVIGAHSKESGASPFPLGHFIYQNVLCEEIPPPPGMFPAVEDTTNASQWLRQRLEAMTSVEPCWSCHSRIGPPGFAFLPFDPLGRYKNLDARGQPYDTTGALIVAGAAQKTAFDGASDLAAKLAALPAVQKCLARRVFRWTHGRYEAKDDAVALAELESAVTSQAGVAALLRQIVGQPGFGQVTVR
jgi:hypothetical protein